MLDRTVRCIKHSSCVSVNIKVAPLFNGGLEVIKVVREDSPTIVTHPSVESNEAMRIHINLMNPRFFILFYFYPSNIISQFLKNLY